MNNINFNKDKGTYSFYSAKITPWHKLGTVTKEALRSDEVIKISNLDYNVVKVPNLISLGRACRTAESEKIPFNSDSFSRLKENLIPSSTSFSNIRTDNWDVLGEVGKNYEVVQNHEMFTFIDDLVGNKEARFETAGCLGKGEVIFMSLKLPDIIRFNNGDDIGENYLLLVSSHDGSRQIDVLFTPVRVVCQNTLNMALSKGFKNRISMKHTKNVRTNLVNLRTMMGLHRTFINDVQSYINVIKNIQVSEQKVNKIISEVIFIGDELQAVARNNYSVQGVKDISTRKYNEYNKIKDWVENGVGQEFNRGTGLWVYNGVNGYYNNGKEYKTEDERFEGLLYGNVDSKLINSINSTLLT